MNGCAMNRDDPNGPDLMMPKTTRSSNWNRSVNATIPMNRYHRPPNQMPTAYFDPMNLQFN